MTICDHDYEAHYCDRCGKYQGMECNHCGNWYDGGDHMSAQPELWCTCGESFDDYEQSEEVRA
jgi:hypothetical protein